jgi:hypothetical protein
MEEQLFKKVVTTEVELLSSLQAIDGKELLFNIFQVIRGMSAFFMSTSGSMAPSTPILLPL